jgi:hypothetical protein
MAGKSTPTTAEQYAAVQGEEWGTYVAAVPIDYYGVRAYNTGDPVPASVVGDDAAAGRWIPDAWVTKVGKDAEPFTGSATVPDPAPPTIDPAAVAAPAASTPTPTPEA